MSKAVDVKVVPVIQDDLIQYIQATGQVKPKEEHTFFAQTTGKLLHLYVKSGDHVEENQIIAELDPSETEYKLQQLQLQATQIQADWSKMQEGPKLEKVKKLEELVHQHEINVDVKTKEWKRLQSEYEMGVVPKVVWQQKEDELKLAKSALEAAHFDLALVYEGPTSSDAAKYRAKLQELRLQQDQLNEDLLHMRIISKQNGTVTDLPVREGQWVTKGTQLMTVANLSELEIVSQVKESNMSHIYLNQEAIIDGSTLGKEQLPAQVIKIAPVAKASPSNQGKKAVIDVTLDLKGENTKLLPGLNVDVHYINHLAKEVLQVPIGAIKKKNDGTNFLWVVHDNKAIQVPIETGKKNEKYIEVTKGVKVDDLVIVNIPDSLRELQHVKVID